MTWGEIRFSLSATFPQAEIPLLDAWIQTAYATVLEMCRPHGLGGIGRFQTIEAVRTGSVSVTKGSRQVVGSGTDWQPELNGAKLILDAGTELFTITIIDDTHLELDREFTGETASGVGYVIFQDEYALPAGVKYIKEAWNESTGRTMLRASQDIVARGGSLVRIGSPMYWWHGPDAFDEAMQAVRSIVLFPAPERSISVKYSYDYAAPAFTGDNTNDSPPAWLPWEAILLLAQSQGYAHAGNNGASLVSRQNAERIIAGLVRAEAHRQGPTRIRIDPAVLPRRTRSTYR